MTSDTPPPVRSMTGFGSAERLATDGATRVGVEIRSVNHRGLKVSSRLPSSLEGAGTEVEARLRAALTRGAVQVTASLERPESQAGGRIVEEVVAQYVEQARRAAEAAGITADVRVGELLGLPGVVERVSTADGGEEAREILLAALDEAVAELLTMREQEGAALVADLLAGAADVERLVELIQAARPEAVAAHRDLRERLTELLSEGAGVPEELIAREMAVQVERSDVAEETTRLASHLDQWREALAGGGAIGRRLDFLAQEMGREANTLGAKTAHAEIGRAALDLKLAVDRLKEQAANVE